jgi:precorrin-6A synthase
VSRRLLLLGIGPGDPRFLTLAAVEGLRSADVVFVLDKGDALDDLAAVRREVLAAHAPAGLRVVTVADPPRDLAGGAYDEAVAGWHAARSAALRGTIEAELAAEGAVGAFLVWGDPSLYDSTQRVVEDVLADLPWPVAVDVVPGISSLHLLTASHRIPLNRVGAAVLLTTGRRLLDTPPDEATDVVVFLDGSCRFTELDPTGIDVYWGAYLGSPEELLVAGPLADRGPEIVERRAAAKAARGWVFDTYLLRWRG